MRLINSSLHGVLDYAAAVALMVLPFLLGLEEQSALAHWISVIAGVGLIGYSLLTQYAFSLAKIIPFNVHLILDIVAAVFFIVAPFILDFESIVASYYWVMGAGVAAVVVFSNSSENKSA